MSWLKRLLGRGVPHIAPAHLRDASGIAALHAASFHRGWSDEEVENLLLDPQVLAHSLRVGGTFAGFVMSRSAADEAEILSIAVTRRSQGRGLARQMLDLHMRRLAALGVKTLFLEVAENNRPAIGLYRKAGFRDVAKRPNYYPLPEGGTAAALVLRRDIA
ncbi:GNAT family N-acetyltransferase [Undibacter mobilis]|uniref:GNAT family N-acetyltransferase n=1 Tax=Undibacter mobilis TaxID=2292256 RepID=A0A371B8N3_9BRAD|nr:GNAT family N-acetyltransferase [Undibacter mobilis]RDV03938.1 GNAT family N-acetyltransferase [Undibacter mobilis]